MSEDEFCCEGGVGFTGDDEVGLVAGRCDEGVVHGAYGGEVLLGDGLGGAPAFGYIAGDTAGKADVCIGINEYFKIAEVA